MIKRDWLRIEHEPWRDREELEAENAELRAAVELWRDRHAWLLAATNAALGRPRKKGQVSKRHARRLRREAARQQAVEEILLALGESPGERLGLDFTQPACAELRAVGIRWQLREENGRT